MTQTPYGSLQKSELYAVLIVLIDYMGTMNIVTNPQYAERIVMQIETSEYILHNTELTLLLIQKK